MQNRNENAEKDSLFLQKRIVQNMVNQKINLNEWIFSNIEIKHEPINILELCCGTGQQTKYISTKWSNSKIDCVDISEESLKYITQQSFYNQNITLIHDDLDNYLNITTQKYDIIFCSYGLYYSKNVPLLLTNITNNLTHDGVFVLIGPYGNNNKPLFDLLIESQVSINNFVIYSSTNFMYHDVISFALNNFKKININTIVNQVSWHKTEDIIEYWKNSTFFDAEKLENVNTKLNNHFANFDTFINEKHIMMLQLYKQH